MDTETTLQESKKAQLSEPIKIIGTIAAILSSISLLPQLAKTIRERNVEGLSKATVIINICSSALWLVYHRSTGTIHGAISSTIWLIASSILLYYIITIEG